MIGKKLVINSIIEFINEILPKKAKIAILVPIFSTYDGVGRIAEQQARELSEYGYDVSVYTLESNITLLKNKIKILKAPRIFLFNRLYKVFFFLDIRNLRWVSELKNFDMIIAHHYPLTYLAYLAKKKYNIKYCFFNHGQPSYEIICNLLSRNIIEKIYNLLINKFEDWTIKNIDFAISNSLFSRKRLIDRVKKDSVVIYNKVDSERFKIGLDGRKIRERYGIGVSDPLILFVGRIVPSKGIHLLIEAFRLVKQEIPNAKLMIVGNPYYRDYFKKIKEMADKSVIFAGYIPDDELPYYYAACDVFATCSLWEGFNLPLAEAQACGKPVVAFDIGPHREIIKNGFLVKVNNIDEFAQRILEILRKKKKLLN